MDFSQNKPIFDKIIIMDIKKVIFKKGVAETVNCFENKLKKIKIKHSKFLKENNIDFDDSIIISYDNFHFKYYFDKKISTEIERDTKEAFNECLANFSK